MSKKKRLKKIQKDEHICIQAMDRCHVVLCMIDDILQEHPAFSKDQSDRLDTAQDIIADLYQECGSKLLELEIAK